MQGIRNSAIVQLKVKYLSIYKQIPLAPKLYLMNCVWQNRYGVLSQATTLVDVNIYEKIYLFCQNLIKLYKL